MNLRNLLIKIVLIAVVLSTTTSCLGSFTLFGKLREWNSQVSSKFVNELLFVVLWPIPAYPIAFMADLLVLNSIEFWSGSNPAVTGRRTVETPDGKYIVACDSTGYDIYPELDPSLMVRLDFDAEKRQWSLTSPGGESLELFTYVDDCHIQMPMPTGERLTFELSASGVMACRRALDSHTDMALCK